MEGPGATVREATAPGNLLAGIFGFQYSQHSEYGAPAASCGGHPEESVDLAEIPDGLHVTPVYLEHESGLRPDDSHKPLPTFGKSYGITDSALRGIRKDAYKSNVTLVRWIGAPRDCPSRVGSDHCRRRRRLWLRTAVYGVDRRGTLPVPRACE